MDANELKGEVLHIVSPEKSVNYKWEDNINRIPSGLQIISIDDYNSLPDIIKKSRFGVRNISEDAVLILEPYTRQYISATDAEQVFFDRKFDALSKIASLLGASKVSRKVESLQEEKRVLTAEGDISYRVVEISTNMKKENFERYRNRYEKIREYSCPSLTNEGYKEALRICEETGLIYDQDFKSLLDQRNPNHPNPMKKETYHIELSKELNESLEVAFHLNILKGVFTLNAGIQESISSSKRLVIETVMEF